MHCFSFLKALKEHLDVEVEVDAPEIAKKSNSNKLFQNEKDQKNKMKIISSKIPHIGVVGKRTEGLHLMTTLALTYAHLSRNTVLTLEVRILFLFIDVCTCESFFYIFLLEEENSMKRRIFFFISISMFSYISIVLS